MIFRLILILFISSVCFSQTADTSLYRAAQGAAADSLSAAADTVKKGSDINAVIYSSGSDSLIFRVDKKQLSIYGSGQLKYKNTELKSENINVDFNTNSIQASGVPDTSADAKSKFKGTPVMSEGGEVYEGNTIAYNFKTQRGLISGAKNKNEGNLYGGSKVKKISPDAYYIKDGTYTTCDADSSHYFFYAKEMKVILKDQIIGRWIWLYIGGVPLPVPLPFGVFPNQTGRRSGIIAPAYGKSDQWGQYFSHLGYYWAISDYFDANLLSDIYFRGGYNLKSNINYAKRYSLGGNINLGYSDLKGQKKQWNISVVHRQVIDPTMSLNANLQFMSSFGYVSNTSYGRNDLLNNQTISSSAAFAKNWESGNTLSLGYSRTEVFAGAKQITESLPLLFSKTQAYPFRRAMGYSPQNSRWYEDIGYSYSGNFDNQRNTDTSGSILKSEIQHNVNVSASPKLGYFSITPNISYTERWYNKMNEIDGVTYDTATKRRDKTVSREVSRLSAVRTFSIGATATTKLYGLVQPRALGIEAVRHVIIPSVSYSYSPDFSTPFWGYFGSYRDSAGNVVRYNKYQNQLNGGIPSNEQQNINVSISNNIEMKTMKDPSDTTSEAKKIQIISFTLGTGYNFAAGVQKRLSPLFLNYHTQIAELINLSGSANYSFYDWDYRNLRESDRYLSSRQGGGLMRLTNMSIQAQVTLSAERFKSSTAKKTETPANTNMPSVNRNLRSDITGQYLDESPDYSIPWDLSMSLAYNLDKNNPALINKTTSLNGNLNFNLTPSLKIAMSSSYDLKTKQLLYPEIRVFKDLHCWEMNFTWNPAGSYSGYRFEIRIKASQLKDIKLEKSYGQYQGR